MIAEMCATHKPHEQHLVMALGHVYVDICPENAEARTGERYQNIKRNFNINTRM